jgi:hypothetical protein
LPSNEYYVVYWADKNKPSNVSPMLNGRVEVDKIFDIIKSGLPVKDDNGVCQPVKAMKVKILETWNKDA